MLASGLKSLFQERARVSERGVHFMLQEDLLQLCEEKMLLTSGDLKPANVTMMFAKASQAWHFALVRSNGPKLVRSQFLTALAGIFFVSGTDPFKGPVPGQFIEWIRRRFDIASVGAAEVRRFRV